MASTSGTTRASLGDVKSRSSGGPTTSATKRTSGTIPQRSPVKSGYATQIKGVFQIVGFTLLPVNPPDACAIGLHAEPIAVAVEDLAFQDERIRAILDRILAVGPYGVLLSAVMPLVLQVLANHNMYVKPGQLGTMSQEQVMNTFAAKQEAENPDVYPQSANGSSATGNVSA